MTDIAAWCADCPVLPVLTFEDIGRAKEVCAALLENNLCVLEITFRKPTAAAILAAIANAHPNAVIAAGSIRTTEQLQKAKDAGAQFAVSPGSTDALLESDILPLLPGAATASEIMRLETRGIRFVKFFPAVAAGGVAALQAFAGPLPEVQFCPTGGVNEKNAADFLALPNVVCVGGSWLAKVDDDINKIKENARRALRLGT